MKSQLSLRLASGLLTVLAGVIQLHAQPSAFTYQGRLNDTGQPATGIYDLRFTVYEALNGGTVRGGPLNKPATPVTNGLFTVTLDFGSGAFDGADRWLEIAAGTNGAPVLTPLAPRQPLTPTPYAILAGQVSGAVPAAQLTGLVPAAALGNAWKTGGNAGTTPGAHFLGTTDNQPVEVKVNGTRALRIEPNVNSPNLIGGHLENIVSNGFAGATISGGGGAGTSKNKIGGNYGTIGGGAFNTVAGHFGVVGGGAENVASGANAAIGGGVLNEAGEDATVGGGYQNRAPALKAAIGGGQWNYASGNWSFVGGGLDNRAGSNYSAVAGGQLNLAQGPWSAVGGGQNNVTQPDSTAATVVGGHSNRVWGSYATVAGGQQNRVGLWTAAFHGSIGGGDGNTIEGGGGGVISGGVGNSLDSESHYSVVGGGQANRSEETQIFTLHFSGHSTIGGGRYNRTYGQFATIGGGATNRAYGADTVAGTVSGGVNNLASFGDTVSGGRNNLASGGGSTVPGGYENEASGNLSLAAGYQARASHTRSFVWSSRDNPAPSFATNRFHVHASEGFSVDYAGQRPDGGGQRWIVLGGYLDFPGQTISTWTGARLTDGGVWTDNSDRNAKENFAPVDGGEVLAKVVALPVQTWNYKMEDASVRHLGPVAQDFHAAFGLGNDDKHLAALDSAGVALAAIQGLNQKLEEQLRRKDAQLASQQQQITELLHRLGILEKKLDTSEIK